MGDGANSQSTGSTNPDRRLFVISIMFSSLEQITHRQMLLPGQQVPTVHHTSSCQVSLASIPIPLQFRFPLHVEYEFHTLLKQSGQPTSGLAAKSAAISNSSSGGLTATMSAST